MNNPKRRIYLSRPSAWKFFLLVTTVFYHLCTSPISYAAEQTFIDFSDRLFHSPSSYKLQSIANAVEAEDWVTLEGESNIGYVNHPSWFKLDIPKEFVLQGDFLLEIANIFLENVNAYIVVDGKIVKRFKSGSLNKLSDRPITSHKIVFPLLYANDFKTYTFYFEVSSASFTFVPIKIWQTSNFLWYERSELLFAAFSIGGVFIIGLFNLFLYLRIRTNFVIFYSLGLLGACLLIMTRVGISYAYLWPETPISSTLVIQFLRPTNMACYILGSISLLSLSDISYRFHKLLTYLAYCSMLLAFGVFFLPMSILNPLTALPVITAIPSLIFAAFWLWSKGYSIGKYSVLATLPLFLGVLVTHLSEVFGVTAAYVQHIPAVGTILLVSFLTLSVAHKISLNEIKNRARLSALNRELEQKVVSRTHELAQTMSQLKSTQHKLIETEKVASMTGLVSALATKMDKPIDEGKLSVSDLKNDSTTLKNLFHSNKLSRSPLKAYLEKCNTIMKGIQKRVEDVSNLVKRFKSLALETNQSATKPVELKKLLEATVKQVCQFLSVQPTIQIECDEKLIAKTDQGLIQELISELINNSMAHAFDDIAAGQITIKATLNHQQLTIFYADNGKGMAQSEAENLFMSQTNGNNQRDKGLGKTIIYNIIKHGFNGEFNIHTGVNDGLIYNITLPVMSSTTHTNDNAVLQSVLS